MANKDMFLKMEGITGCTLDKAQKEWSDVLDWSWGVQQTGSSHHMSGSGEGKVFASDLTFTKWQDPATATFYQYCITGKHAPTATFLIRRAGGAPEKQLEIKMKQVIVTSVSSGMTDADGFQIETISLNFAEVEIIAHGQASSGSDSAPKTFAYSFSENDKC
jgi:type VI secretion system secreted protein Hcp